jgi:hypothetical protein
MPHLNPSQTVERIREIIVGRHLDQLENRVIHLESAGAAARQAYASLDRRLYASEACAEALKESFQRFTEKNRKDLEVVILEQRAETQRLAAQIQYIASTKSSEVNDAAGYHTLEKKIGSWMSSWQKSFQDQLQERDEKIQRTLRAEIDAQARETRLQLSQLENRMPDRDKIEQGFHRIAQAARALADGLTPMPIAPHPATP